MAWTEFPQFSGTLGVVLKNLEKLQEFVFGGKLEVVMNWILLVNSLTVAINSVYDLNDIPPPEFSDNLELWFSFIYVTEVLLKCAVLSWGEYWVSSSSNKFDCVTSFLLFAAGALRLLLWNLIHKSVVRYLNILRSLRLLRLMNKSKRFKLLFGCVIKMFTAFADIVGWLFLTLYFYSGVGM